MTAAATGADASSPTATVAVAGFWILTEYDGGCVVHRCALEGAQSQHGEGRSVEAVYESDYHYQQHLVMMFGDGRGGEGRR